MKEPSLTVLFITKNEERHIDAALDNVADLAESVCVVGLGAQRRSRR